MRLFGYEIASERGSDWVSSGDCISLYMLNVNFNVQRSTPVKTASGTRGFVPDDRVSPVL
jgi:hypothetical protein